ncbi:hypothetical protein BT93_F0313 [Corymbia citriodora subsp. variegata]|nr:hypothetical protein BT93_F0313 [Corymbia citriodora subsp. variegata]
MISSSVLVWCLVAVTAVTIGATTARAENAARPSSPLPPESDALQREHGGPYDPTAWAVTDDYGGWGPAPDTGGGLPAPIPHPTVSGAANSRPHDWPEPAVGSKDGRASVSGC